MRRQLIHFQGVMMHPSGEAIRRAIPELLKLER